MGCDGGTIPKRDELVKKKKKPEKKDKDSERAFRWRHCKIRQLPLRKPIVACSLGRLYSKESVIEGLLDKTMLPTSAEHIKSLKDVKTLNLTPNPAYQGDKAKTGGQVEEDKAEFFCPLTSLEMNGKHNFCFLWTCGCVFSERALKEIKSSVCQICQKPFDETDVVLLNAEGEELKKMEKYALLRKSNKKSKKVKNGDLKVKEEEPQPGTSSSTTNGIEIKEEIDDKETLKSIKKEKEKVPNGVKRKEEIDDKETLKRIKREKEKVKAGTNKPDPRREVLDPAYVKVQNDYSVAKDPEASEVLKSIFTSHKSASEQTKAHWVTYNPFYN